MTDLILTPALVEHHPLHDAGKAFMVFNHTNHLLLKLLFVCIPTTAHPRLMLTRYILEPHPELW